MFYLDVPFMCIYALVSIINNTIQYKYGQIMAIKGKYDPKRVIKAK